MGFIKILTHGFESVGYRGFRFLDAMTFVDNNQLPTDLTRHTDVWFYRNHNHLADLQVELNYNHKHPIILTG